MTDDAAARAREWQHAARAAVCDVVEPWAHGTVLRATRYPSYYDYNLVRVEDDPRMTVDVLIAFADDKLAELAHRRVDFDVISAAEPLRAEFEADGWKSLRLLWLRHEVPPPAGPDIAVEHVPYDAVHDLREAWHAEDFPGADPTEYHEQARAVALSRNAQVLAVREHDAPVAFAQVERLGDAAEITQVYVHPTHRGGGFGTAMTRAAIMASAGVRDLWIAADDEDRPKELYQRLGFRPAWTTMEFTRWPQEP